MISRQGLTAGIPVPFSKMVSGVFYVAVPEDAGPIIFRDPRCDCLYLLLSVLITTTSCCPVVFLLQHYSDAFWFPLCFRPLSGIVEQCDRHNFKKRKKRNN